MSWGQNTFLIVAFVRFYKRSRPKVDKTYLPGPDAMQFWVFPSQVDEYKSHVWNTQKVVAFSKMIIILFFGPIV